MSRSESPQSRQDQSWSAYVATWTDPVPGEAAGDGPIWDDEETYFPLFCLTEVPADVRDDRFLQRYILLHHSQLTGTPVVF